ncbi:hypothetical protein BSP36_058 [Bacillus phage BSP36]|uniref:Membrane-bound protein n=1 Tax=Bacillus phage BSP38 TaxID=2283013 RepID=A0A345MJR9_BPBSP|nr:hemolysin [Bacillus phage BSP38]AXH71101.1 hypothetical protein BSP38_059 [Bacillus phage BSP38]AYJ75145.1 hypothetical protein BSP36_058 [Bacillus phage BSP36]
MAYQDNELIQKLKEIEDTLQDHKTDNTELKGVVNELREIVQSLDKDMAIHAEKQSHLLYRVEQLHREMELLEEKGVKTSDKQRALIENALMAFLGGLITYIFSTMGGK